MDVNNEILDAIEIMVGRAMKNSAAIYTCRVVSVNADKTCVVAANGGEYTVKFYGNLPTVNNAYALFTPYSNMSKAFIIVGEGKDDGGGGGTSDNAVLYTPQSLTSTEKSQARTNIGAGTSSFDGDYNSLSNRPTIPTVNNATLTIQQNGTTKGTFTANSSSNVTANITVPTKTSDITNDSGYITSAGAPVQSVNTKTGAVVLTQDDVGDGSTYVRTHNDFTDADKQQITTNKDDIVSLNTTVQSKQDKPITRTVTIRAANWNTTAKSVTAQCSGVTASSNIVVTPSAGSYEAYCQAGVRCTAATDNTLAFKCTTVPTANLTANVLIFN